MNSVIDRIAVGVLSVSANYFKQSPNRLNCCAQNAFGNALRDISRNILDQVCTAVKLSADQGNPRARAELSKQ
jgi:hypothetical protein